MMNSGLLSVFSIILFGTRVILSQDACEWYTWLNSDWPNDDQNFLLKLKQQGMGSSYLNQSDFEEGGEFYGSSWEEIFWTGVNHTASPPTAYYRPLGFRYAKLGPWNNPTICIRANGVAGYKVELMVYTLTPSASLCMKDMDADNYDAQDSGAVGICDSQYIYNCFTADTDKSQLKVAIYCDTNCEDESNVHILWRFRRSALRWEESREFSSQNPEMWCDMIARDINWPDQIDEAVPEVYSGVDNVGSDANNLKIKLSIFVVTLFSTVVAIFLQ